MSLFLPTEIVNEVAPDLMSVNACAGAPSVALSAARSHMYAGHLPQAVCVKGVTPKRIQNDSIHEFGEYTFNIKTDNPSTILKVIRKFPDTIDSKNEQIVVILEDAITNEIKHIHIKTYCSNHSYFGYDYNKTKNSNLIFEGSNIPENTVFMESPNKFDSGEYNYGVECNIVGLTHPGVSEDSIVVSEAVLDKFVFHTYHKKTISFGNNLFPLNIFGDKNIVKIFPNIGDKIGVDGVIMALRKHDPFMAVVEQTEEAYREYDSITDKVICCEYPEAEVVDIHIYKNVTSNSVMPSELEKQLNDYHYSIKKYYEKIVDFYQTLRRNRGDNLNISKEFRQLVIEAMIYTKEPDKITLTYKNEVLDPWRIQLTLKVKIRPTIGFKWTGDFGDKGVGCTILPEDQMPIDELGNRAEMIVDPMSTVNRMNTGRMYEWYFSTSARDFTGRIKNDFKELGYNKETLLNTDVLSKLEQDNNTTFVKVKEEILMYYKYLSPKVYELFQTGEYNLSFSEHLKEIIRNGIYLHMDTDIPYGLMDLVRFIRSYPRYRPHKGKLQLKDEHGRITYTNESMRVSVANMMLLEKIGNDGNCVSSAYYNHLGVPGGSGSLNKDSKIRNNPTRTAGEAEVRNYAGHVSEEVLAEVADRATSIPTHEEICKRILTADQPTNIERIVDRKRMPYGQSRPLQLVEHILYCGGSEFIYENPK